ncbi:hypothetical protein [Serratia marcescens]|uniref:hypothetical protein n=1 Tax=Serratia marcescens TaxID=615 RepID=UPI001495A568|nr:hypothetical protein [Serratia marcescens]
MNKLSELSKPVGYYRLSEDGVSYYLSSPTEKLDEEVVPLYSQEYVSALDKVAQYWIGESAGWKKRAEDAEKRIEELEWRELNSTELKELLTWHPTENSAATDPILWAAMRNKINLTRVRVASDEAKKEQSNG